MAYKRISPQPVVEGGTGAQTFTSNSLIVGNGTSALSALGAATNGQIPIGSTSATPSLSTLSAGANMTITNGPGSITLASSTPASACSFFAWKKNASQSVSHGSTAVVTFDTIDINNGSVFASNVFTAPATALYYVAAQISAYDTVSAGDAIAFYKNGVQLSYSSNAQSTSALYFANSTALIVSLSAGNTIDIRYLNQTASGSASIGNSTSFYITYFMGYKLT